jgi:hypothetical protein
VANFRSSIFGIAIGASLIFAGFAFWKRVQNTPFAMREKLADCTNELLHAKFTAPKGELFNLVLGVPGGIGTNRFTAEIELTTNRKGTRRIMVTPADLQSCNWLEKEGCPDAYILTWSADASRLSFEAESTNTVVVRFTMMPPTNSSLWVTWIQRYQYRQN